MFNFRHLSNRQKFFSSENFPIYGNPCGRRDESSVEVGHSHKFLQAFDSYWRLEAGNGIHFVGQWHDTNVGDAVAKEVNAVMTELALGDIDDQAVRPKSLE